MADIDLFNEDEDADRDALGLDLDEDDAGTVDDPAAAAGDSEGEPDGDAGAEGDSDEAETGDGQDKPAEPAGEEDESEFDAEELEALARGGSDSVPHARFNEVNEALKREREQNEQLRRQLEAKEQPGPKEPDPIDLDALEQQYAQALVDGDTEAAAKLRADIRKEERRQVEQEVEASMETRLDQREAQRLFRSEAQRIATDFPQLADGEGGDAEAIQDVVDLRDLYIQRGQPAHVALRTAAGRVAKLRGWTPAAAATEEQQTAIEERRQQRQNETVQRNAGAAARQPPRAEGVGNRGKGVTIDLDTLSQDDYEKLPQSERDKLLGNA